MSIRPNKKAFTQDFRLKGFKVLDGAVVFVQFIWYGPVHNKEKKTEMLKWIYPSLASNFRKR